MKEGKKKERKIQCILDLHCFPLKKINFKIIKKSRNKTDLIYSLTFYQTKTLDVTKLKAFADDKSNIGKITFSLLDREENTVGKGENAGYQHFLPLPPCFPKPSLLGMLKVGIIM